MRALPVQNIEEAIHLVRQKNFDPETTIPVEIDLDTLKNNQFFTSKPYNSTIDVERFLPEYIEIRASSDTDCTLFVADAFAPGWTATIDDMPTPIYPGLIAGRSIAFPQGKHRVVLTYQTPGLRPGIGLSVLGWILLCFYCIWRKKRHIGH